MVIYPRLVSQSVEKRIFLLRGSKVMLDAHLADLFGLQTKVLIQSVKRNIQRFPSEFMFQLSEREYNTLRSQFVTSKKRRGGRRYLPYAFTEHGVAMLATVLHTERAIQLSIQIIKAFVRLRQFLASHKDLEKRLYLLEERIEKHDEDIHAIVEAIQHMVEPEPRTERKIGFHLADTSMRYREKKKAVSQINSSFVVKGIKMRKHDGRNH